MKAKLSTVVAAAVMVVAIAVVPSMASAETALPSEAATPASLSECPSQTICLWATSNYSGEHRSFWSASQTGCHALSSINPESVYNNTNNRVAELPGWGVIGEGVHTSRGNPFEGELCIR